MLTRERSEVRGKRTEGRGFHYCWDSVRGLSYGPAILPFGHSPCRWRTDAKRWKLWITRTRRPEPKPRAFSKTETAATTAMRAVRVRSHRPRIARRLHGRARAQLVVSGPCPARKPELRVNAGSGRAFRPDSPGAVVLRRRRRVHRAWLADWVAPGRRVANFAGQRGILPRAVSGRLAPRLVPVCTWQTRRPSERHSRTFSHGTSPSTSFP